MSKPISPEQLNAFVIPAVEVLEKLARISSEVGTLRCHQWAIPSDALYIAVGIEGDLNGQVIFQFDPEVVKKVLASLLGTTDSSLTDPESKDALGELANMIAGNATARLANLGLNTVISPPKVLTKEEVDRLRGKGEGIVIPLECVEGEIGIGVFLENA